LHLAEVGEQRVGQPVAGDHFGAAAQDQRRLTVECVDELAQAGAGNAHDRQWLRSPPVAGPDQAVRR
jgi:hypothetical protein